MVRLLSWELDHSWPVSKPIVGPELVAAVGLRVEILGTKRYTRVLVTGKLFV